MCGVRMWLWLGWRYVAMVWSQDVVVVKLEMCGYGVELGCRCG